MHWCLHDCQTCLEPKLKGLFTLGSKVSLAKVLSPKIRTMKYNSERGGIWMFLLSKTLKSLFEVPAQILPYLKL